MSLQAVGVSDSLKIWEETSSLNVSLQSSQVILLLLVQPPPWRATDQDMGLTVFYKKVEGK